MAFALAIASFFKANVRIATGTGCFICFLTMLALSFAFIRCGCGCLAYGVIRPCPHHSHVAAAVWAWGEPREQHSLSNSATAAYFFASVPFGMLGAYLGMRLSLRISDTAIFFFISIVAAIVGCVIAIQSAYQD